MIKAIKMQTKSRIKRLSTYDGISENLISPVKRFTRV